MPVKFNYSLRVSLNEFRLCQTQVSLTLQNHTSSHVVA